MPINIDQLLKEHTDQISGGKGDKLDLSTIPKDEIEKGIDIELEHTDDPQIALDVVSDHEKETIEKVDEPVYYEDYLIPAEDQMKEDAKKLFSSFSSINELIKTSNEDFDPPAVSDTIPAFISPELLGNFIKNILDVEKAYFNDFFKIEIGLVNNCKVFLVDGDVVEKTIDMDFVEAGHDLVYDYIGKNEIWVDVNIDSGSFKYLILHESMERHLMETKNMSYEDAHKAANQCEKLFREMSESGEI